MESVSGKRPGTRKFFYEGYAYHYDVTSVGHMTYRCATRSTTNCRGAARVEPNEVVVVVQSHNHYSNPHIVEETRMRCEVLRLCRESLRSFDEIFRDVSLRYQQAAINVTLQSMRSSMKRERALSRPPTPNNLADFDPILRTYRATRDIYRGLVRSTDGSIALLFGSLRMVEKVNDARVIWIDATFRVVPRKPKACQLLIIHTRTMDVAFPVLYVLCERRTKQLYIAIWRFILDLAPRLRDNLSTVICDYEKALLASVRQVLPGVRLQGCWFHYCQALSKRWRRLRLARAPREVLWMSMSLPLVVPATRFLEGLNLVATIGNRIANVYPAITQFFGYMTRQWLPLAEIVAVGEASLRTNNVCETFHRHIVARLGGCSHPSIWILFQRLDSLIIYQEIEWQRVQGGRSITRGRTPQQVLEDARIVSLQDQLAAETVTLNDFLHGIMEHRRRAAVAIDAGHGGDNLR